MPEALLRLNEMRDVSLNQNILYKYVPVVCMDLDGAETYSDRC